MRIIFLGTPEFGKVVLDAIISAGWEVPLVVTQPDRPGRKRGRTGPEPSVVGRFAAEQGLEVKKPSKLKEIRTELEGIAPYAFVVASYGQIIPDEVLAIGRWVNVHASLLPAYRGASPIQQAILDGRTKAGVTLMEVVAELDAGPVISQRDAKISPDDTAGTLSDKLASLGGALVSEDLPAYIEGKLKSTPQDDSRATMTKTLTKQDGEIDWSKDAGYLARFIRAMQPWPGAWTAVGETTVTILTADSGSENAGKPGEFSDKSPLTVGAGSGSLTIRDLKPAGKPAMPADAWLRGFRGERRFGGT